MKFILDHSLTIKNVSEVEKVSYTFVNNLKRLFTYDNPTYKTNKKYGYSNYNVEEFLYTYRIIKDDLVLPRGQYKEVLKRFKTRFNDIEVIDRRNKGRDLANLGKCPITLREDQVLGLKAILKHKQGILIAYTSFGKCHKKGTQVILANGNLKNVEDIRKGDQLLGPDSKPRNVLETCTGFGDMYEIETVKGEKFTVNSEHKLYLQSTRSTDRGTSREFVVVTVEEYLGWGIGKRHRYKMKRPLNGVEFIRKSKKLPFDPYFIGLWLGDGTKGTASLTNNGEPDIEDYLQDFAMKNELTLVKKIPEEYLYSSQRDRKRLLAGLIDADGYLLTSDNRTFELTTKDYIFSEQVKFLSRSLGLSCVSKKTKSKYRRGGKVVYCGHHYRLTISGNTQILPLKIKRRIPTRKQRRTCVSREGFSVRYVGKDSFYGFSLDGDHLYLTSDFFIHHNTFLGTYLMYALKKQVTVVVHTTFLQKQWVQSLVNDFKLPTERIGGCGGMFNKPRLGDFNVCLYQTLSKSTVLPIYTRDTGVVIVDEVQRAAVDLFSTALSYFGAEYRIGLTAGVERKDGKEFLVTDILGDVFHEAIEKDSDSKILSYITIVHTNYFNFDYGWDKNHTSLVNDMSINKERNLLILRRCFNQVQLGKQVMIIVERKEQCFLLQSALESKGIKVGVLAGATTKKDISLFKNRRAMEVAKDYDDKKAYDFIKKHAENKDLQVIIGTQKAEVGLSIRTVNHLIISSLVTSNIKDRLNQIVGRVERTHGKEIEKKFGIKQTPTVDLLMDTKMQHIRRHVKGVKEFYRGRVTEIKIKKLKGRK